MENPNKQYFREKYPDHWLANRQARMTYHDHRAYQEITLDQLDCFSGCTVFESGCGNGELLLRLATQFDDLNCFGLDLGRESLKWAKNSDLKNYSSYLIEGDISDLPVKENTFDRVYASSVLWYLPQPAKAIREMIRILKPEGKFVFDVRNPLHVTNILTWASLKMRSLAGKDILVYSFYTPKVLAGVLGDLPVNFEITGYFVFLPTSLPLLGRKTGNLVHLSPYLSFQAGKGKGKWLAQKLLVTGEKINFKGKCRD